ncbi:RHS repeat-associated core domain-containing protein [Stenotrophomonas sp. AB1(2024)]|uniref:RHS repeat-associated core domain-containing protein n=1 Tax=Stenotrophomonas sp. AB1(2024) TaxID=3132215 RepID=UPI0030A1684A
MLLVGLGSSPSAIAQTTVTYIHTDALGSVVAESDANGNVIKRYDYEPYGAVVDGQVADGPGYTGHVSDSATELSYMQQRYMDPQLGMFLSVDPVTAYEQPLGQFNRYRYGNGNPYKFTDPDGRQAVHDQPLVFYQTTTRTTSDSGAVDVARTNVSNYGVVHGTRTEARGTVTLLPQKSLGGKPANPGPEVTIKLLNFSDKSGQNIEVTSGQRTVEQNRTVGGASRSQHLQDNAADIRINGNTAKQTADAAHGSGEFNRVNQYTDGRGVHVDLKQDGTQGRFTDWKPKK